MRAGLEQAQLLLSGGRNSAPERCREQRKKYALAARMITVQPASR
jgi:hypothetical protein